MELYNFKSSDQIGALDAESDRFLSDCFLESNVYETLEKFNDSEIDFMKRIIVGRTGSGKTALLKMLSNSPTIKKYSIIEAESTVFEHINNNVFITELAKNNIDLRVFYKSLWMHVLLIKVIETIYNNDLSFYEKLQTLVMSKQKKYNLDLANEYIQNYKDNFFNDRAICEITENFQNDLKLNFGGEIIGIKSALSNEVVQKVQRETAKYVSSELLKKQKELLKLITEESPNQVQSRIIISIDDLDKSWLSNSNIRYDFINSLLDAFKELINLKSVKILISIRTDILMGIYKTNMRQEEKDRSLIIPVEWKKNELKNILDKRISHLLKHKYASKTDVHFSDIFNFNVRGMLADEYIIQRTMMRPRDAIDFVNYCFMQSDGKTRLNEDIVIEAEERYYVSRKNALKKEWLSQYKHVDSYIDSISYIETNEFNIEELPKEDIQTHLVNNLSSNDEDSEKIAENIKLLINVWFTIGIVGIKKTDTVIIYSSFDKPNLDISDYNKTFIIHPLFYRR